MSDADDAYKVAQRLIAEAKESGSAFLNLDVEETRALTTLPPEISDLKWIEELDLDNTQVTDLSSIAGLLGLTEIYLDSVPVTDLSPLVSLTGLTKLWLDNSQVADLRPLLPLIKLAEEPEYSGITYHNTPAAKLDPKLAELSKIEDPQIRATKTFAYLREVGDDWPPIPETSSQIPAPLQAEFNDGVLIERLQPSDLPEDTANRAHQGWEALSEFHSDVMQTLMRSEERRVGKEC